MAYEPVAYDKSIVFEEGEWRASIRRDDTVEVVPRNSLLEAQDILACFPDDVFEGIQVQPSVFYGER